MIYFEKTNEKIDFIFWGHDYLSAKKWVYEIDRDVFLKQMTTGLLEIDDKTPVKIEPHILELMKRNWEQGYIAPEYGAFGSYGIHGYRFVPDGKFCSIEVHHFCSETTWQIKSPISIYDHLPAVDDPYPLHYDLCVIFGPKTSPKDYGLQSSDHKELIGITCSINGQEYENLKNWEKWNADQAVIGRFRFIFNTTSIGIEAHVNDLEHDKSIDITDYGSW